MSEKDHLKDELRGILVEGEHPSMRHLRHLLGLLPSGPRCKLCNSPFGGIGGAAMRAIGRGPFEMNPRYCRACVPGPDTPIAGIDVELTMLFVDVRGSTALAENLTPGEFSALMNRFYRVSTAVLTRSDALIDKLVGDEVIGLYVPGFAGEQHAFAGIQAAVDVMKSFGYQDGNQPWISAGGAVHTGVVHIGMVGAQDGIKDLTALGDAMNTAARLVSQAEPGQVIVSEDACQAVTRYQEWDYLDRLEKHTISLRGRKKPIGVRLISVGS